MRQIEAMTTMLGYLLSGKTKTVRVEEQEQTNALENELYLQLQTLVMQGNLCEAENLLFEAMDEPSAQVLDAATRFYADLNHLSNSVLAECNFSRDEILEGLQEVCRVFGIPL